jgi:hypothetical protein
VRVEGGRRLEAARLGHAPSIGNRMGRQADMQIPFSIESGSVTTAAIGSLIAVNGRSGRQPSMTSWPTTEMVALRRE